MRVLHAGCTLYVLGFSGPSPRLACLAANLPLSLPSCWLSLEGGLLYAFVGPAAAVVLVRTLPHGPGLGLGLHLPQVALVTGVWTAATVP